MAKASVKTEDPAGAAFESDAEDNIIVNLRDIEEMSFEVLPKGVYPVHIDKMAYALSESSGKPMWKFVLTVTDGPQKGKKLYPFLSFSEGALPGTKSAIRTLDPELLDGDWSPKSYAEEGKLVGWEGRVRIDVREYQGSDRNNVTTWMKPADAFAA